MRENTPQSTGESDMTPLKDIYCLDLLESLLQTETPCLWNPTSLDTEDYLSQLEENFALTNSWEDGEDISKADLFFQAVEQSCAREITLACNPVVAKFEGIVPSNWLDSIMEETEKLLKSNLSAMDRLVLCAKSLFDDWYEDDLQVFARPLVYAMRSNTESAEQSALNLLQNTAWDNLSEVEKIRITMTIVQGIFNHPS